MSVTIPSHLKGKALTAFLLQHKSALIAQKKAFMVCAAAVHYAPSVLVTKDGTAQKAGGGTATEIPENADSIRVKLVGNTAYWMDSQYDVLLPDCWAKSISEGKGKKHLHDHIYRLDAEVGIVASVYSQDIALKDLGLPGSGTAQCLVYESDVLKSYNEKVFEKYRTGKVTQHSIGIQYVKIELAINDPESEKEFDFWSKHIEQVINREAAEERGFFWVVSEVRLLEVSAVLFGANELTPTLEITDSTKGQPSGEDTAPQPEQQSTKSFLEMLHETQLVP